MQGYRNLGLITLTAFIGVSEPTLSFAVPQTDGWSAPRAPRADRRGYRSNVTPPPDPSPPANRPSGVRLPTGPGTCVSVAPSPESRFGAALRRSLVQTYSGQDGQADFDIAAQGVEDILANVESDARRSTGSGAAAITFVERLLPAFEICAAEGRAALGLPPMGTGNIARWRSDLEAKSDTFAATYGAAHIRDSLAPQSDNLRQRITESPILSAALRRRAPVEMAQLDEAMMTPEDRQRALAAASRATAQASASARAAGLATMPERAGSWRRTGQYTYERSAPSEITARLSCGELGGVVLRLSLPAGRYFVSAHRVTGSQNPNINAYATLNGAERRFDASLWTQSAGSRVNYPSNTQTQLTQFDNSIAVISIQSTQEKANYVRQGMNSVGDLMGQATGAPRNENPVAMLMDLFGAAAGAGIEGSQFRNLEISDVRNLSSLPLAIDVEGIGKVRLFDLQPTQAPFRNLMAACWS